MLVNSKPFVFLIFCIIFPMKDAKESKSSKIIILTGRTSSPKKRSQNGWMPLLRGSPQDGRIRGSLAHGDPKWVVGPLLNGRTLWLINGGGILTTHDTREPILQVASWNIIFLKNWVVFHPLIEKNLQRKNQWYRPSSKSPPVQQKKLSKKVDRVT